MRKFLIAIVLATTVLWGCQPNTFTVKPVPTAEQAKADPKKAALDQITNFNAVITAAARSLKASEASFSEADYTRLKNTLIESAKAADKAEVYAGALDFKNSDNQMKLANAALLVVQNELIKLKNKETQ